MTINRNKRKPINYPASLVKDNILAENIARDPYLLQENNLEIREMLAENNVWDILLK